MNFSKRLLLTISLLLTFKVGAMVSPIPPNVIYGEDDRQEARLYPDREFREKAESVAGLVEDYRLGRNGDSYRFAKISAEDFIGLCPDERFSQQNVLPICTGVLIGPDLLATAGHCVSNQSDCEDFFYAFGHHKGVERLSKEQVYKCEKLIETQNFESETELKDYALIQLDRKVVDRRPLKVRTEGHLGGGMPLVVIGHPMGLPLKISDGGKTQRVNFFTKGLGSISPSNRMLKDKDRFKANVDTFGGNSGSPVFNREKGVVEGLLSRGENDFFTPDGESCRRAVRLDNDEASEQVFRIDRIENIKGEIQSSYQRHNMLSPVVSDSADQGPGL